MKVGNNIGVYVASANYGTVRSDTREVWIAIETRWMCGGGFVGG